MLKNLLLGSCEQDQLANFWTSEIQWSKAYVLRISEAKKSQLTQLGNRLVSLWRWPTTGPSTRLVMVLNSASAVNSLNE
uniref:Uncharacterized protein n=1 Tax=Mesocestoides corti TaxID=53468 RepID=A0A5K3FED1_MESCO